MMGQMIGVLIDQLRYGGVEKVAINEVRELRKMGHNAVLVVMRRQRSGRCAFREIIGEIPIIYLSDRIPRMLRLSFGFPIFAFFSLFHLSYPLLAATKIKEDEFNVIVSHGTYTCFTAFAFWKLKKIPFIAYIWDPVDYIIERVYTRKIRIRLILSLMRVAGRLIDKFIVQNSKAIITANKRHLIYLKMLGGSEKVAQIIYPSAKPFETFNINKENFILLVTAWKEGKEPEYLFDILRKIHDVRFVLAGDWLPESYSRYFINKVKTLGYEKQVSITGKLSEEDLAKLYAQALVFLQLRADIGFGMPALEAASNGCTFIIPEGQGVCNLFEDGLDGFYVKEKDTERIINYINVLKKDRKVAVRMALNAWSKAKEKYSWTRHAKALLMLMQRAGLL